MKLMSLMGGLGMITLFLPRFSWAANYQPSTVVPPKPAREFRGAWVATVANSDWPSKRGLNSTQQKAELIAILDRAAALKLNAIIFQVRPACDAMYASQIEPWSEYLTGAMGKPPEPYYDPLTFAVEEAHKRGLELHAWFNPYRALHPSGKSMASNHVSKTKPQIVREYGKYLWLDPGEKETQDYSLSVVMDVAKRYDVDGIHFDDYFYPYKERGADGKEMDFPDDASWKKFGVESKLSRDDWRRQNVDTFIRRVYESVKATKPWVKFGLSPFGIWRPGHPPQIKGFDAYANLYADSRKWLQNGWGDYFMPQLYWAIEPKEQSFAALLDWWNEQNPKKRPIWPGMNTGKARTWGADEIVNQIRLAGKQRGSAGHVHWNMKSLLRNADLTAALERTVYAEPALVPAMAGKSPGQPHLLVTDASQSGNVCVTWSPPTGDEVWQWVLQTRQRGSWTTEILIDTTKTLTGLLPDVIAVTAVGRTGGASVATVVQLKK